MGGVFLYTVFTPWLALAILWLFALQLGWFPVGKFINPMLWIKAPVNSNYVFHRLLFMALALSVTLPIGALVVNRLNVPRARVVFTAAVSVLVAVALFFWWTSGIGYLAWDIVKHMVLPVLTVTIISFAGTMLLIRNSMLEVLREDFVMAARAKGLPDKVVRDKHAARNALLPVVTSFVFSLAFAIDGGVITETIFRGPGSDLHYWWRPRRKICRSRWARFSSSASLRWWRT